MANAGDLLWDDEEDVIIVGEMKRRERVRAREKKNRVLFSLPPSERCIAGRSAVYNV